MAQLRTRRRSGNPGKYRHSRATITAVHSQPYLETARQAIDHLKRGYEYVRFPERGFALTSSQSTESKEYQNQQTLVLEERAIMIVGTIGKLWRETVANLKHSQDWPGLCRYLGENRDFWEILK